MEKGELEMNMITPEQEQKIIDISSSVPGCTEVKITTVQEHTRVIDDLKRIKDIAKKLTDLRKSITVPMDTAKKNVMDLFRGHLEECLRVENILKKSVLTYRKEEERKRKEEEDRLKKDQEKAAEKLEKRAEKAEGKGQTDKAEDLQQQAEEAKTFTPMVESNVKKQQGEQVKKIWKHKVVNKELVPREYLIVNEKMLGQIARSSKGTIQIVGVQFYAEETLAIGG